MMTTSGIAQSRYIQAKKDLQSSKMTKTKQINNWT